MKLTKEQKAAHRAAFREMNPAEKLEYVSEYYKWPILLALLVLALLLWTARRELTKKEPVLYLALTNVTAGEDLERALTGGYLTASGKNPKRQEVYLYRDLYLSDNADILDHEYAYASRIKLMGAVQTMTLDVVLMNREAYDLLSSGGYLLPLDDPALAPLLTSNEVTLSDNAIEWQLNEAETHERVTESVQNAVALSGCPLFEAAGFADSLYAGVLTNSPRAEEALRFLRYLAS